MLFPNDLVDARAFSARLIGVALGTEGPASSDLFPQKLKDEILKTLAARPLPDELLQERGYWGHAVGEIVRVLWGLLNTKPKAASWTAAVKIVEATLPSSLPGSRRRLEEELTTLAPALHLWGAWAIRGRKFQPDPSVGYGLDQDVIALMMEAALILSELRAWRDSRDKTRRDQDKRLSVDAFGPWVGCEPAPWRLGWPLRGVPPVTLREEELVLLKDRGRPPKTPPAPASPI